MPTCYDPGSDAGEASESMRSLAHASRNFHYPRDLYGVLGEVLSSLRSLRQVLDRLAAAHVDHRSRTFDDAGDHAIGSAHSLSEANELHRAATLIHQAEARLDAASAASGRIAWRSEPGVQVVPVQRWVSICFLLGEDTEEVLQLIDDEGVNAGLGYLKNWDFGDETAQAARENGDVYDLPPTGPLEQEFRDGKYDMTFSHSFGQVSLYRLHQVAPQDAISDEHPSLTSPALPSPSAGSRSWFDHPGIAAIKQSRGLGL